MPGNTLNNPTGQDLPHLPGNPNQPGGTVKNPTGTGLPHAITPEGAVHVVRAEGEFGDKVAIAGFSVSNFGVFASSEQGIGLFVRGAQLAAQLEGSVTITGNCEITGDLHTQGNHFVHGDIQLEGRDYAEDFDVTDTQEAEPGTVMVLGDAGGLRVSDRAYDRRVAGVVSGAGDYKPAVILDHQPKITNRRPLALMGKVYCRVDASDAPIVIGDLLTTSSTPGHAMKAANPVQAFGAVIGKALRPLDRGRGLLPILVALQ
jgi:hypothetical protein